MDTAALLCFLQDRKERVEQYLAAFLAEQVESSGAISAETRRLLRRLSEFTLGGGKRVRAALVALGYQCVLPESPDVGLVAASAAVEVLHAFLLAHDDVFDRDITRHSKPTLHHQFALDLAEQFPQAQTARYAETLAILAGDVLAMYAFELLTRVDVDPARIVRATRTLARVASQTGFGEALDVLSELDERPSAERVDLIQTYKTAKYTFEGPLYIGAELAGADPNVLAGLSAVALPLGVAYQIQDDILGVFGSQAVTGKPVGADLREGKHTLLTAHGLNGPFAQELRNLIGKRATTEDEVLQAQQYLREGGSLAQSEARMRELFATSRAACVALACRQEAKDVLLGLIDWLGRRVS